MPAQRYRSDIRQGYWKHVSTLVGAVQDTETYHWVDYTVPSRLRTQRERIRFTDWLLTPDILEARSKTRREYSQTGYNHKEYNLQQLCLIAYSTANNRTIDSIVLEVDIDSLSIVTCRLVIQVNRGIPIKASTLEPYSTQELEDFTREPLKRWLGAGGFERYQAGGTCFWVDLWEIVLTERNPVLQWLTPEAKQEIDQQMDKQGEEKGQEAWINPEGEGPQPQHSSVSYHQDTTQYKVNMKKKVMTTNQTELLEMPMRKVNIVNITARK